jgi:ATP-binding cassette subfamily F protein 3
VEWLESFLRNQQLPMIIVSHDREFLDRVCTKIVDTDGGECVSYNGNYSNFLKQKRARLEAWQRAWENQQKKIQEDKEFINRFRANSARSAQVKAKEAGIEKLMKSEDYIKRPPNQVHRRGVMVQRVDSWAKDFSSTSTLYVCTDQVCLRLSYLQQGTAFRFRFPPGPRLSGDVVAVERVTHGYNGQLLLEDTSLTVQKGDRVAIIGPNGAGKSTLLRLIMGMEKPTEGQAGIVANNAVSNVPCLPPAHITRARTALSLLDHTLERVFTCLCV